MQKLNIETEIDKNSLVEQSLNKAQTYGEYRRLVAENVANGTSTGPNQSMALSQYTLLNDSRMRRLDKTTQIPPEIKKELESIDGSLSWLVLTESWCGDAAQSMPMMKKFAEANHGINLKVLLRDENPDLMDAFLTNGSKSIPKLIVFDHDTNKVIADWGPRPSIVRDLADDYKKEHGSLSPEFKKDLQIWYNKDKSKNIAEDLINLLK